MQGLLIHEKCISAAKIREIWGRQKCCLKTRKGISGEIAFKVQSKDCDCIIRFHNLVNSQVSIQAV